MVADAIKDLALAGDTVMISFGSFEPLLICQGAILHTPNLPIPLVQHFQANIKVFSPNYPVTLGTQVEVHAHGMGESGVVAGLLANVDPATGQVIKENPRQVSRLWL